MAEALIEVRKRTEQERFEAVWKALKGRKAGDLSVAELFVLLSYVRENHPNLIYSLPAGGIEAVEKILSRLERDDHDSVR